MSIPRPNESGEFDAPNELTAENERAIRRLFEQVYSQGELHVVGALVAPDCLGYCAGLRDTFRGPSGVKSHATRLRAAFFGLGFDVDDIRGTSGGIEVVWTATGRLERSIADVHPTCTVGRSAVEPGGPEVTITGSSYLKMRDGKVSEGYVDWNLAELRAQL